MNKKDSCNNLLLVLWIFGGGGGGGMEPEMKNIMCFVCEYHNKQVTVQNKVCPSYNFEGLDSYIWH